MTEHPESRIGHDVRCKDCREVGIECPQGYFAGVVVCLICTHEVALMRPMCLGNTWPDCPRCEHGELRPKEDEDD